MLKKICCLVIVTIVLCCSTVISYGKVTIQTINNKLDDSSILQNNTTNLYNVIVSKPNNKDVVYKGNTVSIQDDANLLSEGEEIQLLEIMKECAEYGNVLFYTSNSSNYRTSSAASNYYHTMCGNKSGTLFFIDMYNREIYIFSDGNNYNYVTTAKAEVITDNIYRMASRGDYYDCAKEAFSQIKTVLEGGQIAEPMKYISNGLLAIMISLLIVFGIFKAITQIRKTDNIKQITECENFFEFTKPEAVFTGSHEEYSPVDTDSGGSFRRRRRTEAAGGGSSGGRWRSRFLKNQLNRSNRSIGSGGKLTDFYFRSKYPRNQLTDFLHKIKNFSYKCIKKKYEEVF